MAAIIDDPIQVTPKQMDEWIRDFNSRDLCDQACFLFDKTPYVVAKVKEWTKLESEFQKRAGFSPLAGLVWHGKTEADETFIELLPLIEREVWDERNYVKKAANCALREVGKRSRRLNELAIETAERIKQQDTKSARWIAADVLRELQSEKVLAKLDK